MKLLLIGGKGFIGKAFIKRYKKSCDIVAPTELNLSDARSVGAVFDEHKFDAVLYLACAVNSAEKADAFVDSVIAFKNVQYMSIVHSVKKLIYVGDALDLDASRPIVDFTEDRFDEYVPTGNFGSSRHIITKLASKDRITTTLRLFDVYGHGGNSCRINKIVSAAASGKKQITIDRDRTVSAISVDDAIAVIAKFLQGDYPKGDYNLVAADKVSYLGIAKTLKRVIRKDGGDIEIVVKHQPDFECTASNAKLAATVPVKLTPTAKGIRTLYESLK